MSRHWLHLVGGALSALLFTSFAAAQSLQLKNAGFEERDSLQPRHWGSAKLAAGADPRVTGNKWMARPVTTRDWGRQPIEIVPNVFYDGLLQIEVATYPPYL